MTCIDLRLQQLAREKVLLTKKGQPLSLATE